MRFLDAPPAGWRELVAADPNATAAHRPELWEAVSAVVPGTRVELIAVGEGGTLAGGAPLALGRRAGFAWLHALPWVLPGAPLARAGEHVRVDREVADALGRRAREIGALGGEWSLYRPHGPAVEASAYERLPGETTWLETAVIDLVEGLDAAERRVDRKTRRDLREARDLGMRFAEEPGALDPAWALYAGQTRHWPGHPPLPLELARRLLSGPDPAGRLFTARDDRGLLAAAFALDHPRETLVWWSGTHPEGRPRHAFAFLLWSLAGWAAAAGRARLNLGASPGLDSVAAFKRSLGARSIAYPVRWLAPARASLPGRVVTAAQAAMRRGRRRGERA